MAAIVTTPVQAPKPSPAARMPVNPGYAWALQTEFQRLYNYEGQTGDTSKNLILVLDKYGSLHVGYRTDLQAGVS